MSHFSLLLSKEFISVRDPEGDGTVDFRIGMLLLKLLSNY